MTVFRNDNIRSTKFVFLSKLGDLILLLSKAPRTSKTTGAMNRKEDKVRIIKIALRWGKLRPSHPSDYELLNNERGAASATIARTRYQRRARYPSSEIARAIPLHIRVDATAMGKSNLRAEGRRLRSSSPLAVTAPCFPQTNKFPVIDSGRVHGRLRGREKVYCD
jgi:hypothetical protein